MPVKSDISERKQDSDYTMSDLLSVNNVPDAESVIAGSHPTNRKTISEDRSLSCETDTPTMRSSQTSEVDSISKEKDLFPYWNPSVAEMSAKLWLPTETGSQDSDSISSDGSRNIMVGNSWYSAMFLNPRNPNLFSTCLPSSMSSPVGCKDSENTGPKSKKIRVYPTDEQKKILSQWMGTARFTYNRTIEYLKQPDTTANWLGIKTGIIGSLPEWAGIVPYQIKSVAVRDACISVGNAKKKCKETGQFQDVGFRSKKRKRDSIFIPKSAVRSESFYVKYLGRKLFMTETMPEMEHDCRLIREDYKFYLCVPVRKVASSPDNQRMGIVALDPGVRTFQTFFNPAMAGKIGCSDFGRIHRLCNALDKLISKMSAAKCEAKRRMKRAAFRIREKIKNLIAEIHHKTANFLCRTFSVILIPSFETSGMVTKLRSKTARAMLTWAHHRFKDFLKHKAEELSVAVYEVNEAYTSKTCSACGRIHNIGSKKMLKCSCGIVVDRDINGARGIFLRALVDTPSLRNECAFVGK